MFIQVYCSPFCFAIFSQCGDTLVRMGNVKEEKKTHLEHMEIENMRMDSIFISGRYIG